MLIIKRTSHFRCLNRFIFVLGTESIEVSKDESRSIVERALSGWDEDLTEEIEDLDKSKVSKEIETKDGHKFRNIVKIKIMNAKRNSHESS